MGKVKITVSGPGGIIDNEAYLIRDLLVSKGAHVTVFNDYKEPVEGEVWRDRLDGQEFEININGYPWGG